MDASTHATCRLCHEPRNLRRSHIVPAYLCRDPGPSLPDRPVLRRLSEPLLCDDCEGFVNREYDHPFRRIWQTLLTVAHGMPPRTVRYLDGIDYRVFKGFHLSVLFRAAVAAGSSYREVALSGPDLEGLRRRLLAREPGPEDCYPIVTRAAVDGRGRVVSALYPPRLFERFARPVIAFLFGGFEWNYFLTGSPVPEIADIRMAAGGRLPLGSFRLPGR